MRVQTLIVDKPEDVYTDEGMARRFLIEFYKVNATVVDAESYLQIVKIAETGQGTATVYRFAKSDALKEYPIGSFETGQFIGDYYYFDPPRLASHLQGETVIFPKSSCIIPSFFVKLNQAQLDALNKVPMAYTAIVNTLNQLGVNAQVSYNDIVIPKADGKNYKIGCGFLAARKLTDGWFYSRESLVLTYYYDHDVFAGALSDAELNRTNSRDPDAGGITGIENEYPDFNRDEFEQRFIEVLTEMDNQRIAEIGAGSGKGL